MSRSSDCDVWKKEKEVMKIKVTQRLTYPEARKVYEQHKPEFTFSKIVSTMPKKPETKTASTQYSVKDSEITESSKVIIARIKSQNQNTQINQKSSSEKTTQKQQNQTNTNSKQMNDKSNTFLDSGKGTLSALDLTLCHPSLYLDFDWSVCKDQHGSDHFPIVIESIQTHEEDHNAK